VPLRDFGKIFVTTDVDNYRSSYQAADVVRTQTDTKSRRRVQQALLASLQKKKAAESQSQYIENAGTRVASMSGTYLGS